jgi:two-component system cell cycle response regulator
MARRILLIDDDRLQFRLTQAHFRNFRGEQFELEWAPSYAEGLEKLLGGEFAACLLDFQLGERDGIQLIREAVARGCHTPIIFLTAESSTSVDTEAMDAGAMDYLVKGEIAVPALERSVRYALKLGETLAALHRLATHDELTSLLNRREFERVLRLEGDRARSGGAPLSLLAFDVDLFKNVNDSHGHPAGDQVLREIARRLRGAIRAGDFAARLGGDEFAVLLPKSDRTAAAECALRVCSSLTADPVPLGRNSIPVTVSAGVATLPEDGANAGELVIAADKALYGAKARGRACTVRFDQL